MRGLVKKLIGIDSIWYIIFLSLFIIAFYLVALPSVSATEEEKRIEEIDEQRIILNEEIATANNNITIEKDQVRSLKRNSTSTWAELTEIRIAEDEIVAAQLVWSNLRDELFTLLREKSDILKSIRNPPEEIIIKDNSTVTLTKKLGVVISNGCITMIKNNFTTQCPSYKSMLALDSSNTDWSGKFVTDEDGFLHRAEPLQQNSWRLYDFDEETRIFLDPPKGMSERVKLITIVPNFDNYFVSGDLFEDNKFEMVDVFQAGNSTTKAISYSYLNQTSDSGRVIYHDRYVKNCNSAVIDAEDWEFLLVDTINYLRNDCNPEFTEFEEREVIPTIKTEIDITTSPNYQYQQWLEDVKNSCIITRTC